jgi:hypothetical protein
MLLLPDYPPLAPTPAANSNPYAPFPPPKSYRDTCPVRERESIQGVSGDAKKHRTSRAEDLGVGVNIMFLKCIRTGASRQVLIAQIAAAGVTPPSPQPSHALHGYRVTSAQHEEVRVSADGHASAPSFGAAAAVPPAGAP